MDMQVNPGECAVHKDADMTDDGETAEEAAQVKGQGESTTVCQNVLITGEIGECVSGHIRLTRADEENDQRTKMAVDNVPETPPEPLPPPTGPFTPPIRGNEPLSVKLEGERRPLASCDAAPST